MSLEIALKRIRQEAEARTGFLDIGNLGLEEIPDGLFGLTHLKVLVLNSSTDSRSFGFDAKSRELRYDSSDKANPNRFQADDMRLSRLVMLEAFFNVGGIFSDLIPLAKLPALKKIDCSHTQVSDLGPLSALKALTSLGFSKTPVSDLLPLSGLKSLASLHFLSTPVSHLGPLSGLKALTSLDFSSTQASELRPLSGLKTLASLYFSGAPVSDLGPLSVLKSLASLDCSSTRVSELDPLSGLRSLVRLDCSSTEVANLSPLSNLHSLTTLYCWATPVSDLGPLAGLPSLTTLNCSSTKVGNLDPLSKSGSISDLNAFDCPISQFEDFGILSNLKRLILGGEEVQLARIHPEVLSQESTDDCLERVRRHLEDLGDDSLPFNHVKVILLGNARIGKTQIARRLNNLPFLPSQSSTHAINIETVKFPTDDGQEAILNVWDFGGQDIYHGTHALFLKSRAIFVIVWTPESETGASKDPDGTEYLHESLSYWLDYVAKLGGKKSPVIILQNQCDAGKEPVQKDDLKLSAESRAFIRSEKEEDRKISVIGVSAKDGSHWTDFQKALEDGIQALWKTSHPKIGRTRLALWKHLEQLKEDGGKPKLEWIDYLKDVNEFGVSGAEEFAEILHNAGIIFWERNLFHRSLILDQNWCLQAIYAVLTRGTVLQKVRAKNGIFTRKDLDSLVWRDDKHSEEVQEEFLEMMKTCDICFSLGGEDNEEAYIAPDLLTLREDILAVQVWDYIPGTEEEIRFQFPFLAPGVSRMILTELGIKVRRNAAYWKHGVFFWSDHGTAVMIEEVLDEKSESRAGSIVVRTKGGLPSTSHNELGPLLKEVGNWLNDLLKAKSLKPKVIAAKEWKTKATRNEGDKERFPESLPPQTELLWTHERVIAAMRPKGKKNLYVVGSLDRRITFYSQQVRALRLVRALAEQALAEKEDFARKKIAIIGGGVAGITAAVAAARAKCQAVTVFEENNQILQLQARANHRFIHPHIYQWPAEGSGNEDAGLPVMNWKAGNADEVVMELHNELKGSGYVSEKKGDAGVITIEKESSVEFLQEHHDKVNIYQKNCFCPDEFDLVIVTSGFGLEDEEPMDVPCKSYWRPDDLEGPFRSQNPERILVSGSGDGGLIDVARAAIHTGNSGYGPHSFRHSEAIKKLCEVKEFQKLGEALEEVDHRYRMTEQSGVASYDLRKHYHAVFRNFAHKDELKLAMEGMKRADTKVWFNYQQPDEVFNLNSALLNRVLVFLLIECKIVHPLRGRIEECVKEQDLYAVRMKGRDSYEAQRFNRVILRYGPARDYLGKRFPVLSGSIKELRNKGLFFPITKLDPATKAFFEKPKGAGVP